MKILVLGSTGMLGQSLICFFKSKNIFVQGVAKQDADINLDVANDIKKLKEHIKNNEYDVIINAIALINLQYCEENPEKAYLVNTYFAGEIAKVCNEVETYFIQISTDHYYCGDVDKLHAENSSVFMINEYAKTKYLAEQLTLLYDNALVVRTNIVGFRHRGCNTFVEWILSSLKNNKIISGYTNMYTSSIDVKSFVEILYQLILHRERGLINVAAEGVLSKYDFIISIAERFNKKELIQTGLLNNSLVQRGDSLGLSVEKLKRLYPLIKIPTVNEVVENIYEQYIEQERV